MEKKETIDKMILETSTDILDLIFEKGKKIKDLRESTRFCTCVGMNILGNISMMLNFPEQPNMTEPDKILKINSLVIMEMSAWFEKMYNSALKEGMN